MQKHALQFSPISFFFLFCLPFFPFFFYSFLLNIERVYSFEYVLIDNRLFELFWFVGLHYSIFCAFVVVFVVWNWHTFSPKKNNRNESNNIFYADFFWWVHSQWHTKNNEEREKKTVKKKKKQACLTIGIFKRFAFNIQPHAFNNLFDCLSLNRQIYSHCYHRQPFLVDVTKFNTS